MNAPRVHSGDDKAGQLYGCGENVKKFSGLQMEIWKKLFTMEVHSHRVDSGALASSSVWLACACQGCPKKNEHGAARRFLFCGSTVDSARRTKDVLVRISRREFWPEFSAVMF
jgi:hypothetical protein